MNVQISYFQTFWEALGRNVKALLPGGRDIKEEIVSVLDYGPMFEWELLGLPLRVPRAALSMLAAILAVLLLALWLGRRPAMRPGKAQALAESLFGGIEQLCLSSGMNRAQAARVIPFVTAVGGLIIFSNLSALLSLRPAAVNPSFPIALALIALFFVIFMGIRLVGLRGFWDSLLQPSGVLLPFKLLDYLIKPISLAFRLFGNVFGAYILMTFVELLVPIFLPSVLALWFDIGDGIIQGVVFAYLTINYIGEIVEGAESAAQLRAAKAAARSGALKAAGGSSA